jgi:type 1 glutamine amidotransferase
MTSRLLIAALCSTLAFAAPGGEPAKKKVLLVGQGPDGHPATTHEYMAGLHILAKCLARVPELEVTIVKADAPWKEGPELIERSDGVVLFLAEGAKWVQADPQRYKALQKVARQGGGIVGLHWAIGTRDAQPIDDFLQLLGGCHGGPDRKYLVLATEVHVADPRHPIATGIDHFRVKDEFYYKLKFVKSPSPVQPVLQATIEGNRETVAWAWERPDGGRTFGFSGLHFHENWRLPEYRRLTAQAVLWTLQLPIPKAGLPVEVAEEDLKLK